MALGPRPLAPVSVLGPPFTSESGVRETVVGHATLLTVRDRAARRLRDDLSALHRLDQPFGNPQSSDSLATLAGAGSARPVPGALTTAGESLAFLPHMAGATGVPLDATTKWPSLLRARPAVLFPQGVLQKEA